MIKFLLGAALGAAAVLAGDYVYPEQAHLTARPGEQVVFEVETWRVPRKNIHRERFIVPVHDGSDEGECPGYSDHWFGLCVPA